MTQISNYPISKDVSDRIFDIFLKTFVRIKNIQEADQFISDLLTPTEKVMLAKRLAIALLLEKNYDYRTIQKIIRVSAPTIASVNSALRFGNNGYKKLIEKITQEGKLANLLQSAVSKLLSASSALEKGKGKWSCLQHEVDKQILKRKRTI